MPMSRRAFACLCEDVRIGDLADCVAQGFAHPELVKRRPDTTMEMVAKFLTKMYGANPSN